MDYTEHGYILTTIYLVVKDNLMQELNKSTKCSIPVAISLPTIVKIVNLTINTIIAVIVTIKNHLRAIFHHHQLVVGTNTDKVIQHITVCVIPDYYFKICWKLQNFIMANIRSAYCADIHQCKVSPYILMNSALHMTYLSSIQSYIGQLMGLA